MEWLWPVAYLVLFFMVSFSTGAMWALVGWRERALSTGVATFFLALAAWQLLMNVAEPLLVGFLLSAVVGVCGTILIGLLGYGAYLFANQAVITDQGGNPQRIKLPRLRRLGMPKKS